MSGFDYYTMWIYLWCDDMATWGVWYIFPLWCFILKYFMHVYFGSLKMWRLFL